MTHAPSARSQSLVLASASPRRRELLAEAGIEFEVVVSGAAETDRGRDETCEDHAMRVAGDKARAVAEDMTGRWVLGADTMVVLGDELLGKPVDEVDAARMLVRLSGRTHRVITGIALARTVAGAGTAVIHSAAVTHVTFRDLSDAEIAEYVRSGEPMDKAGAYGIQGLGGALVAEYDGSYTNVVGLPMEALLALLREHAPSVIPTGRRDEA